MGNSKSASGCQIPSAGSTVQPLPADNGILSRVRGDYIAQALATLQPPTRDGANQHQVVIDAGHLGAVRLYIERKQVRHRKHSHFYWAAYRAEAV